ncbi:DUF4252 domain-containing protein [Bacteroidota bacterium]
MKINRSFFSLLFFSFLAYQSCVKKEPSYTDELYNTYESEKGFFIFDIPPKLLGALIGSERDNKEIKAIVGGFDKIKVLVYNESYERELTNKVLFDNFNEYYAAREYREIATKRDSSDLVKVKLKQNKDNNGEMIIIIDNSDAFMSISLKGLFDEYTLTTLVKEKNLEIIKKVYKNKK